MKQVKLVGSGRPAISSTPRRVAGITAAAAVAGILGLAVGQQASAGCPTYTPPVKADAAAHLTPAVYHPASALGGAFVLAGDFGAPAIVGLWKIEFLAKGNTNGIPDGALIDFGTAQWHEDGTETMISGGRNPSDGDVCMGVWQQVGRSTYSLTHVALAWHAGAYVGPAKIIERVTVDAAGDSFRGTFTITQYATTMSPGTEFDENTVVPPTPIHGVITGTRVTAN